MYEVSNLDMRWLSLIPLFAVLLAFQVAYGLQISPTSTSLPSNSVSYLNISFYNNENSTLNISIQSQTVNFEYTGLFSNVGIKPSSFILPPGHVQKVLFSFSTRNVFYSSPIQIQIPYTENGVQSYFTLNTPILPQNYIYIYSVRSVSSSYPYNPIPINFTLLNSLGQTGITVPVNYSISMNNKQIFSSSSLLTVPNLGLNSFSETAMINNRTPPGNYTITVSTVYNQQRSSQSTSIEILPYTLLSSSQESNIGWLGGSSYLVITNNGNAPANISKYVLSASGFYKLFLTGESASAGGLIPVSSGFISNLSSLAPGESVKLAYTVSFAPIYVIVIVVAILILLFLFLNRKVKITKEVVEHHSSEGFVDIKMAVRVKNVTINKKPITDIVVYDYIPKTALKVSIMGPKEGKIERVGDHLKLIWREQQIAPGDEIILMYEIKSKIGLLGGINLPSAECRFNYNGKIYTVHSNALILNIK